MNINSDKGGKEGGSLMVIIRKFGIGKLSPNFD